jgi:hypothetical protein
VPSEARITVCPRPATRLRKPGRPLIGVISGVPSPHIQTVPSALKATLWVPPAAMLRTSMDSGAAVARRAKPKTTLVKLLVTEPLGLALQACSGKKAFANRVKHSK